MIVQASLSYMIRKTLFYCLILGYILASVHTKHQRMWTHFTWLLLIICSLRCTIDNYTIFLIIPKLNVIYYVYSIRPRGTENHAGKLINTQHVLHIHVLKVCVQITFDKVPLIKFHSDTDWNLMSNYIDN